MIFCALRIQLLQSISQSNFTIKFHDQNTTSSVFVFIESTPRTYLTIKYNSHITIRLYRVGRRCAPILQSNITINHNSTLQSGSTPRTWTQSCAPALLPAVAAAAAAAAAVMLVEVVILCRTTSLRRCIA
jgi:hypothetical protein